MVKVTVNGRFAGRRISGVDRYASEITGCWNGRIRLISPRPRVSGMRGHLWEQLVLPRMIADDELLWSPANSGPVVVARQVVTIHDLSVIEHPEWFAAEFALWYRLMLPWLAGRARRVLTVSDYSRRSILQRFGLAADKVTAIPNAVNMCMFKPCDFATVRAKYRLPEKYVLFVGSIDPRKNLPRLLQAWTTLSNLSDVELVIAGARAAAFRPLRLDQDARRVRLLGYVADEDLPALYGGALFFIMPSLYEGFGLTVLEAMACGTPVIASRAGALPEVTAGAALEVAADSVDEIATAMRSLLSDPALRHEFRQKGLARAHEFSWERSAQGIWEVLEESA